MLDPKPSFDAIYTQYFGYIRDRCRPRAREQCEDVAQEVFFKVLRALPKVSFESEHQLLGWLRTIAQNTLVDYQRKVLSRGAQSMRFVSIEELRQENDEGESAPFEIASEDASLATLPLRLYFENWLHEPTPLNAQTGEPLQIHFQLRRAFSLRLEGYTAKEIGAIMGRALSTVQNYLVDIHAELREGWA